MENLNQKQINRDLLQKIRSSPELFFERVLGTPMWAKQKEIAQKLMVHRRVAVSSCNGAGKTFFAPRLALWFLVSFPYSVVINTAPTWRQIENQYWRHFRDAYNKSLYHIGGTEPLKTQFNFQEDWFAIGVASSKNNIANFQGWHAKNILIIFDEASGIPKQIWEAVEGNMSGGVNVRFLAIGNPNTAVGDFQDCFKSGAYEKVYISAFDLPNVIEKRQVIPGLSTWEWVEEMREKYGEDSDIWRVRVLGLPPQTENDTLIPIGLLEGAFDADRELSGNDEWIGLDPARYGDDRAAFTYRKGNKGRVLKIYDKSSLMELSGQAVLYLREFKEAKLMIDIIGVGAGIYDRLKEIPEIAGRVYGVNSAGKPREDDFVNIRMESWAVMKRWLKDGILEKHEGFYQLAQPKFKITSNGKMQLESKEDMKKRGVRSPDVGDSFALTFARATEGSNIGVAWI